MVFFFNDSSVDCMARMTRWLAFYTHSIPTVAADESPTLFRLKLTDVGQDYAESTLIFTWFGITDYENIIFSRLKFLEIFAKVWICNPFRYSNAMNKTILRTNPIAIFFLHSWIIGHSVIVQSNFLYQALLPWLHVALVNACTSSYI